MRNRTVHVTVACLALVALLLASCGTTTSTPQQSPSTPAAKPITTSAASAATPSTDKPKYGGTVTFSAISDPMGFDETYTIHFFATTLKLTNEELLTGDWAKGPAGNGQTDWTIMGNIFDYQDDTGSIAESWQIVEPGHIVYKIRQGIHYGLNPSSEASRLVNGRELTADDVVWTIKRYCAEPTSFINQSCPTMVPVVKITAPDKWTVDIQSPRDQFMYVLSDLSDFDSIIPPEVTQKYGNMKDWHNSVGTGPYFLTDFVSGSSVSFDRNPNYWGTDPVGSGKGNQLPYADHVKVLVIPDTSTVLSALRTGKLDTVGALTYDDANEIRSTAPQLVEKMYAPESGNMLYMRTDKQNLPFKDKRVRQALMMATDFDSINKALYGGTGITNTYPITPVAGFMDAYLSLDEAPAAVQELYKYNPDKAKSLLNDAGYPNGFKTTVVSNSLAPTIDYLSVIKGMWAKVGVDLTLDPRETGAFNTIFRNRSYDQMDYGTDGSDGVYPRLQNINSPSQENSSYINDPHINDVGLQMAEDLITGQTDKMAALHKDLMKYVLEQAWVIPSVLPQRSAFWWPWLKGYHGEQSPGNNNMWMWAKYVWVDQDLKATMLK